MDHLHRCFHLWGSIVRGLVGGGVGHLVGHLVDQLVDHLVWCASRYPGEMQVGPDDNFCTSAMHHLHRCFILCMDALLDLGRHLDFTVSAHSLIQRHTVNTYPRFFVFVRPVRGGDRDRRWEIGDRRSETR